MPSLTDLNALFWGLVGPWLFLARATSYLPSTILRTLRSADARTLLSPSRLQDAWFSAFWSFMGPQIREGNGERMVALLEGRMSAGHVLPDAVHAPVSGVVLEIGPGSGYWVNVFSSSSSPDKQTPASLPPKIADGVKRVYGVEPNVEVHPALRQRVREAGLEETYEIVPAGIESLSDPAAWGGKIEKGSVDSIVSILCLCSIPEPEKNIPELYSYLKKGGRWYLYEHVQVSRNWPLRLYQRIVNLAWPRVLNGCQLCRDTGKTLRSAGPWGNIDLAQPPAEPWFQIVPHIVGTLTK
ncbi:methyltransferase domain-containing protein [Colletotrichum sojae]|uniref:Methyltransferase domain-containing protein n=1 Tax=Colletotrichum sojae TaxID=2175907 RepID=A0A8H6JRU9_9PEZI|nr:methyltransferase domain-containing protein [Colletotrichum sojae]